MKCAVIGAGRFGKNHVRTLHQMGTLQAVAELHDATRESVESEFGVPTFKDYREMLESGVDSVCVATPAHVHYPVAKDALRKGLPTLVEKPLTLDVAEGEELVRLARENDTTLMVGHLLIYQPAIQWIRNAITGGLIGNLKGLHQERLNLGKARDQENALWSLGVHDVAVALFLIGSKPLKSTFVGQSILTAGVEDDTYVHMEFEGGIQAHIHSSWMWPELRRNLVLVGDRGMLVFDEPGKRVIHHKKSIDSSLNNVDEGSEVVFEGDAQPLKLELEHFLDCAANKKQPQSDGESAVEVLRVLASAKA